MPPDRIMCRSGRCCRKSAPDFEQLELADEIVAGSPQIARGAARVRDVLVDRADILGDGLGAGCGGPDVRRFPERTARDAP